MKRLSAATKTVAYCRVSTDEQAANGVSLAAQRERIEAFAVATGRTIDEFIVGAGESAKSLKRPGMIRLVEGVKCGTIGAVIVLKLDRATRSVKDLLALIELFAKANADLISVSECLDTSSAAGRMVVQILGVMSEFERAQLSERTAGALGHLRRNRRAYAHPAFGWRRDGDSLTAVPEEQWALSIAKRKREQGVSLRVIGEWFTSQEFSPRQGGKSWRKQTVAQVLSSRIASESA